MLALGRVRRMQKGKTSTYKMPPFSTLSKLYHVLVCVLCCDGYHPAAVTHPRSSGPDNWRRHGRGNPIDEVGLI